MENKTARLSQRTQNLVLGGGLIALATVLSFIKVFDLPYGGSITLCSMLPIMLYSYKCGIKWGLSAGLVYAVIQFVVGADAVKGLTIGSVIGVVAFDYIIAFTMIGFAGLFRNKIKNRTVGFTVGAVVAGFLRYISHILAGFIFWGEYAEWWFSQEGAPFGEWAMANLDGDLFALAYSTVYNGTYMLPEIIITAVIGAIIIGVAGKQLIKDNG